jgi:hypothetical protein
MTMLLKPARKSVAVFFSLLALVLCLSSFSSPVAAQAKTGLSGNWEWTSRPDKEHHQTAFFLDLKQRGNKVSGTLGFALLVDGENDGSGSSQIPYIGTVTGDVVTIEFDPDNVVAEDATNVRYKRPKGKAPSTATLRLKNGKLEWTQVKGKMGDSPGEIPRQLTMRRT